MSISFDPAADPLGHTARLDHSVELPLLGVPVRYRSNSPAVIAAVERALQIWRDLPQALVAPGAPAVVDVVVHPAGASDPPEPPGGRFVFRAHGDTVLAAVGSNLLVAHMAAGKALAFITPALAADQPALRERVIECLGLLLVNMRDRTPIHAAGLVRAGRALLLLGPSGAGKSTLCYACVRAGFALLAEDTVSVSLASGMRVWGHPGPIHLLPDAVRLFPELAGVESRLRQNGKYKLPVELEAGKRATHADRAIVCLIERTSGQASRLEPLPAEMVETLIARPAEPGFDLMRPQAPAVARALLAGSACKLKLGTDPANAAALLAYLADA